MKKYRQAVLFLSDKSNDWAKERYQKLADCKQKEMDIYFLYHKRQETIPEFIPSETIFSFTDDILYELGYKSLENKLLPGSNHFPLLKFFLENPRYDYYWLLENDVVFSGSWNLFFDTFKPVKSDFISSYVRKYEEEPYWYWWWTLKSPEKLTKYDLVRSFNPIYRLSNNALQCLDTALRTGWSGHHEATIPTILYNKGLKIRDFGGLGSFVPRGFKNRFYTPESMWHQPVIMGDRENILYHPIKEEV